MSLLFLATAVKAVTLTHIRFGSYPERIRAAFDFDGEFKYTLEESKEKIIVNLLNIEASSEIQNFIEINDFSLRYLEVEREDYGLKVTIPLAEPVPYNIFSLSDPPRLVIDFDREFTNIISGGTVIDGVESLTVAKSTVNGRYSANVLKVDLSKADVLPALSRKRKLNALESFINNFNPFRELDPDKHFFRARVADIAEEHGAVAAVNGTYFAYTGRPLGTLLIDKELVSSPIHDRTALILADDNQAYIDNIMIESYFQTASGEYSDITGINQGRGNDSIIMYTPVWGDQTATTPGGLELVIANSTIKDIKPFNAVIPQDGYVLSLNGPTTQAIKAKIKAGDKLDVHIKIIPFSTSPKSILHMVSGGPRLVKDGIVYVSKYEEQFKSDIAQGRSARTAVGVTRDNKLLLVTVDGLPRKRANRSEKSSIGMTLEELAELLINLGADEAMNLDGGSSTTMWIDGKVVNRPVGSIEQRVSNALIVRPKN